MMESLLELLNKEHEIVDDIRRRDGVIMWWEEKISSNDKNTMRSAKSILGKLKFERGERLRDLELARRDLKIYIESEILMEDGR